MLFGDDIRGGHPGPEADPFQLYAQLCGLMGDRVGEIIKQVGNLIPRDKILVRRARVDTPSSGSRLNGVARRAK